MSGFYGRDLVEESRDRIRDYTGKLTAATLRVRATADTFTNVNYANAYIPPTSEQTALGTGGTPNTTVSAYLWQMGESTAPSSDDLLLDSVSVTWLILNVNTSCNADSGYAVHQLSLIRSP